MAFRDGWYPIKRAQFVLCPVEQLSEEKKVTMKHYTQPKSAKKLAVKKTTVLVLTTLQQSVGQNFPTFDC